MISINEFLKKPLKEQEELLNNMQAQLQAAQEKEHGLYKYSTGCRCEICRDAKRQSNKKYSQKKKEV